MLRSHNNTGINSRNRVDDVIHLPVSHPAAHREQAPHTLVIGKPAKFDDLTHLWGLDAMNGVERGWIVLSKPPFEKSRAVRPRDWQRTMWGEAIRKALYKGGIGEILLLDPDLQYLDVVSTRMLLNGKKVITKMRSDDYERVTGLKPDPTRQWQELDSDPLQGLQAKLKRIADILIVIGTAPITVPLGLAIAALIKFTSPGPSIFTQQRVGLHGRPFKMLKFRSMVQDAEKKLGEVIDLLNLESTVVFKVKNDSRVTPVGRILRRTSLDELPQLINVLRGEMSIVGPRPEEQKVVECYPIEYLDRLKARPGITGLQQIACRGVPDMEQRMIHDRYYVYNRSLLLDLKIFMKSFLVVLTGKGAE